MFRKILSAIFSMPGDFYSLIVTHWPGPVGDHLRHFYWKCRLKHLGKNTRIETGAFFQEPRCISIGDHCWIDRNVVILSGWKDKPGRIMHFKTNPDFLYPKGEVVIGDRVHISPNCVLNGIGGLSIGHRAGIAANSCIYSLSHHYRNLDDPADTRRYVFSPVAEQGRQYVICGAVVIGDEAGVGSNSVVLPGVSIGAGAMVAAGSVVSKNIGAMETWRLPTTPDGNTDDTD